MLGFNDKINFNNDLLLVINKVEPAKVEGVHYYAIVDLNTKSFFHISEKIALKMIDLNITKRA